MVALPAEIRSRNLWNATEKDHRSVALLQECMNRDRLQDSTCRVLPDSRSTAQNSCTLPEIVAWPHCEGENLAEVTNNERLKKHSITRNFIIIFYIFYLIILVFVILKSGMRMSPISTSPSAPGNLSITNPARTILEINPDGSGDKPVTTCLIYGKVDLILPISINQKARVR